jgi:hypothetical protein
MRRPHASTSVPAKLRRLAICTSGPLSPLAAVVSSSAMATQAASGIVASYAAASDPHDEGERRALLERAWADDGVYCDPTALVEGREARIARIVGFLGPFPPG